VELAVVAAHAAIGAVFAAEIRDLNDGADEDFRAEPGAGGGGGASVQFELRGSTGRQVAIRWKIHFAPHGFIKRGARRRINAFIWRGVNSRLRFTGKGIEFFL
jgi:hypothetical protein